MNYETYLPENITRENVLKMIYLEEIQGIENEKGINLQSLYDVKFSEFTRRSVLTINKKKAPLKFIKHMSINYALDMCDHVIKEIAMRNMSAETFSQEVNKVAENIINK